MDHGVTIHDIAELFRLVVIICPDREFPLILYWNWTILSWNDPWKKKWRFNRLQQADMGNPSLVSDHSSICWMIFDVFGLTILFKKYLHSHICMYYVIVYVYDPSTENGNLSIKCPKNWRDRGYWSSDIQSRVVEMSRPGGWFRAQNPSNFHIRTSQNNYGIST